MNLQSHLTRVMSKGRDFVPQIDGLRFVAITAVLAYHIRAIIAWHYGVNDTPAGTDGLLNWTFGAGCKGVELFFAISGFILGVLFALFERPFMQRDWPQKFWAWVTRKKPAAV